MKKLPDLVQPSGYYPLLVMQVGGDEIMERSDEWSLRWTENWLNVRAQRVVISGTEFSWRPVN